MGTERRWVSRARDAIVVIQLLLEIRRRVEDQVQDVRQHLEHHHIGLGPNRGGPGIKLAPLALVQSFESAHFAEQFAGIERGDRVVHGQIDRAVGGKVRSCGNLFGTAVRNTLHVIRNLLEAVEQTFLRRFSRSYVGDRTVDRDLNRTGHQIKSCGSVFAFAAEDLARPKRPADNGARVSPLLLRDLFEAGNLRELLGCERLAFELCLQNFYCHTMRLNG